MKKTLQSIRFLLDVLIDSRINIFERLFFCLSYSFFLSNILLFRPKLKKVFFLNRREFYYSGSHLSLLLNHIQTNIKSYSHYYQNAGIVLDIGASFGTFSLMVNYLNPSARIYAFEPSKESFSLLKKNVQSLSNVKVINVAIGDCETRINFFENKDFPEGSKVINQKIGSSYKIDQITLDSFLESRKIKQISLIKIDVEGYELNVLKGASHSLNISQYVIIEVDFTNTKNFSQVLKIMDEHDFVLIDFGALNRDPYKYTIGSADLIFKKT